MAETESQKRVAVINSNEDIVEAIRLMLDDAGIASVGAHVVDFKKGRKDLIAFYHDYNPRVIVYDIAPPYEENWTFFQLVKATQETQGRHFLLTTTNKAVLDTWSARLRRLR